MKTNSKEKPRTMVIPIEKLEVCPHNPRKRDLDLDELVSSVKKEEVKEVIEVHPHGGKWHVIAGQRRYLAAKKAGTRMCHNQNYTPY
jgi:ParB family chromosome partitioning protein